MFSIKINEEFVSWRIDKYLSEETKKSRNQIQKMIRDGFVLVNQKKIKSNYLLKQGDLVEIKDIEDVAKKTKDISEIKIIFANEDYIILEKPCGLAVHACPGESKYTLVDFLIAKYPEIKSVGQDSLRPGIVHRLDQGVSGVMMVARNQEFFEYAQKLFKRREVIKKYLVLVHGRLVQSQGEISFPIARSKTDKTKMAALPLGSEQARKAITKYRLIKEFVNYSLLEAQILTGRTHQIRVHFKALGHCVAGDKKYGNHKIKDNFKRIFLHSHKLSFPNLAGEWVEYESDLPAELKKYLREIR